MIAANKSRQKTAGTCNILILPILIFPVGVHAGPIYENGKPNLIYAGTSERHESNLFRISDPDQVTQLVSQHASSKDNIRTDFAGFLAQAHHDRQEFQLDTLLNNYHFQNNDQLNHVGGHVKFNWNWNLLKNFSGNVKLSRFRWLGGFEETQYYGKDILSQNLAELSANYHFNGRMAVTYQVNANTIRHGAASRINQNSNSLSSGAALTYESPSKNQIALEYNSTAVSYPDDNLVNGYSTDFDDHLIRLRTLYSPSSITRLTAVAGYLKRHYNSSAISSFSGAIGSLTLNWQRIHKLDLELDAKRELEAHREQGADYYVSDHFGVTAQYHPLETLKLTFELAHERLDYRIGNATVATSTQTRQDYRYLKSLTITYTPTTYLAIQALANDEKRRSNLESDSFDALYYELAITFSL